MLWEEEISARQQRGREAIQRVLTKPRGEAYGDYEVVSASKKTYRVALRGPGLFDNFCSCPDFARNTLGTCKHVESLLQRLRKRYGKRLEARAYLRTRASLSLLYGETLAVRLRLPSSPTPELRHVAAEYFDGDGLLKPEGYRAFDRVIEGIRRADDLAVVYSDVLEFIGRENELVEGLERERSLILEMEAGKQPLEHLLNVPLLPYQTRGALFAASRGRAVLADDMGLGKTIQAIAAAELLRRWRGISRALVIAPASVKYQWKTEIEKFCGLPSQVVDGPPPCRQRVYASPPFFTLTSYELAVKDFGALMDVRPDLIILDEAQRIRNWTTTTARTIKQLKSRYALVLTGTPLENKIEELYSVVEFVDGRRLGPAFRFLKQHRVADEKGKLLGYRGLDEIHRQLEPILLRRTRKEVLTQLPERTDQVFRVPLTPAQAGPYQEQSDILARLMSKWQRQGWLSEIDLRRITCCIQNMRMLCDSTYLFDKETNVSPKLDEFREIIRELAVEEDRKVVVFSEYERMTHLAGRLLDALKIQWVSLHGGVPARKRGDLMKRFREDPKCKVFLSTDAGGVGLNLQSASAVVNFEPPWNPARLEQRIARVHRMGQTRPVQVIHLLTENSIEERVWETLRLKKALFAGLFDSSAAEVSFEKLGRKTMMQAMKEVFTPGGGQPTPPSDESRAEAAETSIPQAGGTPGEAVQAVGARPETAQNLAPSRPEASAAAEITEQTSKPGQITGSAPDLLKTAAGLLEAGLRFVRSLQTDRDDTPNPAGLLKH
ncbi:MAG: DEAD/DEAH box helicase, partial [Candidatus Acidiferrales bacterium]